MAELACLVAITSNTWKFLFVYDLVTFLNFEHLVGFVIVVVELVVVLITVVC